MMGVLKVGKIYVPMDPSYPQARITSILELLDARLILTNAKKFYLGKDLDRMSCRVVDIDEMDSSTPSEGPTLSHAPLTPANIMFPSGSTGQPKGVIQTHRNILHEIMNYTNAVHISAADRLVLLSAPNFATIYGALLNGACLCPWDIKHEALSGLADWFMRQGITIYRSVPSVFRSFVDTLSGNERFPQLRLIYLAGDSVTWADIESYKDHFSSSCVFCQRIGLHRRLNLPAVLHRQRDSCRRRSCAGWLCR